MDSKLEEQRPVIQFLLLEGKNPCHILQRLQKSWGFFLFCFVFLFVCFFFSKACISRLSFYSWISPFRKDRTNVRVNNSQKGLPLETKNTQNHENRRLGLTESLHIQHCS